MREEAKSHLVQEDTVCWNRGPRCLRPRSECETEDGEISVETTASESPVG